MVVNRLKDVSELMDSKASLNASVDDTLLGVSRDEEYAGRLVWLRRHSEV